MKEKRYCESPGLDDSRRNCVLSPGHTSKHRGLDGEQWATPGQVSGNDRWAVRDEALRELLSYCQQNECADDPGYGDVANRLTNILDGEK